MRVIQAVKVSILFPLSFLKRCVHGEVIDLSWMCLSKRTQLSKSSSSDPSDNVSFFHLF